jgi:hypothetical protein
MARPINYYFCTYEIELNDEIINGSGELSLISDNQASEQAHGREKDGAQAQVLVTDPKILNIDGVRGHSFYAGFKQGMRIKREYDGVTKRVTRRFERDTHTKFGHVVTILLRLN